MGTYVVTGGASGIGAAIKQQLQQEGHSVLVVDIQEADIVADLSTAEGRSAAIEAVRGAARDDLGRALGARNSTASATGGRVMPNLHIMVERAPTQLTSHRARGACGAQPFVL